MRCLLLLCILFVSVTLIHGFRREDDTFFRGGMKVSKWMKFKRAPLPECSEATVGSLSADESGDIYYCDGDYYKKIESSDEASNGGQCCPTAGTDFRFGTGVAFRETESCSHLPTEVPESVSSTCEEFLHDWNFGGVRWLQNDSEEEEEELHVMKQTAPAVINHAFSTPRGDLFVVQEVTHTYLEHGWTPIETFTDGRALQICASGSAPYFIGDVEAADFGPVAYETCMMSDSEPSCCPDPTDTPVRLGWFRYGFGDEETRFGDARHLPGVLIRSPSSSSSTFVINVRSGVLDDAHIYDASLGMDVSTVVAVRYDEPAATDFVPSLALLSCRDALCESVEAHTVHTLKKAFPTVQVAEGDAGDGSFQFQGDFTLTEQDLAFRGLRPQIVRDTNGLPLIVYLEDNSCYLNYHGVIGGNPDGCEESSESMTYRLHLLSCDRADCQTDEDRRNREVILDLQDLIHMESFDLVELEKALDYADGFTAGFEQVTAYLVINGLWVHQAGRESAWLTRIFPVNGLGHLGPAFLGPSGIGANANPVGISIPQPAQQGWQWMPAQLLINPASDSSTQAFDLNGAGLVDLCRKRSDLCPFDLNHADITAQAVNGFQSSDGYLTVIGLAQYSSTAEVILAEEFPGLQLDGNTVPTPGGEPLELLSCHCFDVSCSQWKCSILFSSSDLDNDAWFGDSAESFISEVDGRGTLAERLRADAEIAKSMGAPELAITRVEARRSSDTHNGIIAVQVSAGSSYSTIQHFYCVNAACDSVSWMPATKWLDWSHRSGPYTHSWTTLTGKSDLISIGNAPSSWQNDLNIERTWYPYSSPLADGTPCNSESAGMFVEANGQILLCSWMPSSHAHQEHVGAFSSSSKVSHGKIYGWFHLASSFQTLAHYTPQFGFSAYVSLAMSTLSSTSSCGDTCEDPCIAPFVEPYSCLIDNVDVASIKLDPLQPSSFCNDPSKEALAGCSSFVDDIYMDYKLVQIDVPYHPTELQNDLHVRSPFQRSEYALPSGGIYSVEEKLLLGSCSITDEEVCAFMQSNPGYNELVNEWLDDEEWQFEETKALVIAEGEDVGPFLKRCRFIHAVFYNIPSASTDFDYLYKGAHPKACYDDTLTFEWFPNTILLESVLTASQVETWEVQPGSSITTELGGELVSLSADGSFEYRPRAGERGVDSFTFRYFLQSDPGTVLEATAHIALNQRPGIIWVDNTVAAKQSVRNHASGKGTQWEPYHSLFDAGDCGVACNYQPNKQQPGDFIRVATTVTPYDGFGIQLLSDVKLSGGGVDLTYGSLVLDSAAGSRPVITSLLVGIQLGQNNIVEGLIVSGTVTAAIEGTGISQPAAFNDVLLVDNAGHGLSLESSTGSWYIGPSDDGNFEIINSGEFSIRLDTCTFITLLVSDTNIHSELGDGILYANDVDCSTVTFDSDVNWFIDEFTNDIIDIHDSYRSDFSIEVGPSVLDSCTNNPGGSYDAIDFGDNGDSNLYFAPGNWRISRCENSLDNCDEESFRAGINVHDNYQVDEVNFPSKVEIHCNFELQCAASGIRLTANQLPISLTGTFVMTYITYGSVRVEENANEIEITNTVSVSDSAGVYIYDNSDQVAFRDTVTLLEISCTVLADDDDGCATGGRAFYINENVLDGSLPTDKLVFVLEGDLVMDEVFDGDGIHIVANVGSMDFQGPLTISNVHDEDAIYINGNIVFDSPDTPSVRFRSSITMTDIAADGFQVDRAKGDPFADQTADVYVDGPIYAARFCYDESSPCGGVMMEALDHVFINFADSITLLNSTAGNGLVIQDNEDEDAHIFFRGETLYVEDVLYHGILLQDNDDGEQAVHFFGTVDVHSALGNCIYFDNYDDDSSEEITFYSGVTVSDCGSAGIKVDYADSDAVHLYKGPVDISNTGDSCILLEDNDDVDMSLTFENTVSLRGCGEDGIELQDNDDAENFFVTFLDSVFIEDCDDDGIEVEGGGSLRFASTLHIKNVSDDGMQVDVGLAYITSSTMRFEAAVTIEGTGGYGLLLEDDMDAAFLGPVKISNVESDALHIRGIDHMDAKFQFASLNISDCGGYGVYLEDDGDVTFTGPVSITDTDATALYIENAENHAPIVFLSTLDINNVPDGIKMEEMLDVTFHDAVTISNVPGDGVLVNFASGSVTWHAPLFIEVDGNGIEFTSKDLSEDAIDWTHYDPVTIDAGASAVTWSNTGDSGKFNNASTYSWTEIDITATNAFVVSHDEGSPYQPAINVGPTPSGQRSSWTSSNAGLLVTGLYHGLVSLHHVDITSAEAVHFDADNVAPKGGGLDATDCTFNGDVTIDTRRHTDFTFTSSAINVGTFAMDLRDDGGLQDPDFHLTTDDLTAPELTVTLHGTCDTSGVGFSLDSCDNFPTTIVSGITDPSCNFPIHVVTVSTDVATCHAPFIITDPASNIQVQAFFSSCQCPV